MRLTEPFQMKKFSVAHDECAMRVNTDGCLLGALAGSSFRTEEVHHVLDIGTGSGVIALQMAQRFNKAFVDGVEIHGPSARQATENFKNSMFSGRMVCYHEPLQEFTLNVQYDLIVSNPPYFESGPTKSDQGVAAARHALTLDFKSLIEFSSKLLKQSGEFWCILPVDRSASLMEEAIDEELYPKSLLYIKPSKNRQPNRVIIGFSKERGIEPVKKELILYNEEKQYTQAAIQVLMPFYLHL
ncbi:MAG: methyltransferase [Schleiferiaceae bacterium]|nr:methyltransferase [Schleiferiaceae bacterium]